MIITIFSIERYLLARNIVFPNQGTVMRHIRPRVMGAIESLGCNLRSNMHLIDAQPGYPAFHTIIFNLI